VARRRRVRWRESRAARVLAPIRAAVATARPSPIRAAVATARPSPIRTSSSREVATQRPSPTNQPDRSAPVVVTRSLARRDRRAQSRRGGRRPINARSRRAARPRNASHPRRERKAIVHFHAWWRSSGRLRPTASGWVRSRAGGSRATTTCGLATAALWRCGDGDVRTAALWRCGDGATARRRRADWRRRDDAD
jgi:hypothetical protein